MLELGHIWELPMTYGPNQDFVSPKSAERATVRFNVCACVREGNGPLSPQGPLLNFLVSVPHHSPNSLFLFLGPRLRKQA